jgi:hypothetical protein
LARSFTNHWKKLILLGTSEDKNPIESALTPEMIAAGVSFLENEALGTVSCGAVSPEFVEDFYSEIVRARGVSDPSAKKTPEPTRARRR